MRTDAEQIRQRAAQLDADGNPPTMVEVAADMGVSVITVRKALITEDRPQRTATQAKQDAEAAAVFEALKAGLAANMWAPSQRDLGAATGLTASRVNYLLQVLRHQGLIELGPNPREVRIVGSSMVIPEVTL
jgi:DNA-binding transcriptional regulator YhcF (GntR family)